MLTTLESFNRLYPIGSRVWFHNGQSSHLTESRTISKAFMAENGVLAVHVKAKSGMLPIAYITDASTVESDYPDCKFCKNIRRGFRLGEGFVPDVKGELLCPRCFISLPEDSPLRGMTVFGMDERKLTPPEPTPQKEAETPLMQRIEYIQALARDFEKLLENNTEDLVIVKIPESTVSSRKNTFSIPAVNHRVKFTLRDSDLTQPNAHDLMREILKSMAFINLKETIFFMVGEPKCVVELHGFYGDADLQIELVGFWVRQLTGV